MLFCVGKQIFDFVLKRLANKHANQEADKLHARVLDLESDAEIVGLQVIDLEQELLRAEERHAKTLKLKQGKVATLLLQGEVLRAELATAAESAAEQAAKAGEEQSRLQGELEARDSVLSEVESITADLLTYKLVALQQQLEGKLEMESASEQQRKSDQEASILTTQLPSAEEDYGDSDGDED